ncbi:hypothetical protein NFB41_17100 [Yersinia ruckeri]|uniref:hypothetical protein n=1 Tax=Yersinia ruckeri TaxID=29486 RepID=UPI002238B91B|nr:hypothetical protein [Yersinia ruckeri]MCW6586169.1 hypothetical protein [Yersinia ruckeri]
MTESTESKNTPWDNTVLLALATLTAYFMIYTWFLAKAEYYHYPIGLIEVNLSTGLSLSSVFITMALAGLFYWYLLKINTPTWEKRRNDIVIRLLISLLTVYYVLFPPMFLVNTASDYIFLYRIIAVVMMVLAFCLFNTSRVVWAVKLKNKIFTTQESMSSTFKVSAIILVAVFIFAKITYEMSYRIEREKTVFPIVHIDQKYFGVIDIYSNTYILSELKDNNITKSLVIFRADSGKILPIITSISNNGDMPVSPVIKGDWDVSKSDYVSNTR